MNKDYSRSDRVAARIKRDMAVLFQRHTRDPRLQNVCVNSVTVSRDLAYAKIYVSFFEQDQSKVKEKLKLLKKAAGFFRSELASSLKLRTAPELQFVFDETLYSGERLTKILENLPLGNDDENENDSSDNIDSSTL